MWEITSHKQTDPFNPFSNNNLATHFDDILNKSKPKDPFEDLFKIALTTPLSKIKKVEPESIQITSNGIFRDLINIKVYRYNYKRNRHVKTFDSNTFSSRTASIA